MVQGKHLDKSFLPASVEVHSCYLFGHLFIMEKSHNLWNYSSLQAVVDPPSGDEPIGLDMAQMGKGLAWLNGEEIGRYWPRKSSVHDKCVQECDYRGKFMPDKCFTGCGEPTQRW